jgi:putative ABC transport system permease protein
VISPRWRKVLRDLWSNKARTLLVVLSIAVGVAAIGMVVGTYSIITRDLPAQYQEVVPANSIIITTGFNDDFVQVIKSLPSVKDAEGRYSFQVRVQIGEEQWRDLTLYVLPDFENIGINRIFPQKGSWPPLEQEVIIERASIPLLNHRIGDTILVETPQGIQRELKISGLAHDLNFPAGTFTNQASGYITLDTSEWLGNSRDFNQLLLTMEGENLTRAKVRDITFTVEDKIEKSGRPVLSTTIPQPGQHWFIPYLTPMAAILSVLGVIILLLSSLLIVNTISALLSQQIRQIGIMKAIGAKTNHIVSMYLFSMVLVGLLAFAIAVPLGKLGTRFSINILASYINFNVVNFQIPRALIWFQAGLSIMLPVLVALFPILSASRITVKEAINDYGLNTVNFGSSFLDRLISSIQGISRPFMLSLRNTFRRKSRLILTLITLTLGSAIFLGVMNVNASVIRTLDDALDYYGFDLAVFFNREYRVDQIMHEVNRIPEIVTAETWGIVSTRMVNSDGSESNNVLLVAPPTNTSLIKPSILKGRWLLPEDENAVVINTDVLRENPQLKVGDSLVLKIDGSESTWKIVGITRSVLTGPWIYTNYPYYARRLDRYGLSSGVYIALENHDGPSQQSMAKFLEEHFDNVGLRVNSIGKVVELRATAISQFNLIFIFLMLMAIILSVVGGLSLMGTMGLNVLERTREIGIMRAIGASGWNIMQIVVFEGILIGLISWTFGLLLAIPLSRIMNIVVGNGFLRSPLINSFSWVGMIVWLFLIIIISSLASFLPAYNATRLTVRNVLAYE